jgi:hypothetical protein
MNNLLRQLGFLIILPTLLLSTFAFGQTQDQQQGEENKNGLSPHFSAMSKEAEFLCSQFLPNAIEGITELMTLCGGRFGMRTGSGSFVEGTFISGAGRGQRYTMGSLALRGDYALDDFIGSMFIGPDLHYATNPVYSGTGVGEDTKIYIGFHVGGSIWWELNDVAYLRTDLKFNFNPGNSLLVMVGLVLRFDPAGEQTSQQNQ